VEVSPALPRTASHIYSLNKGVYGSYTNFSNDGLTCDTSIRQQTPQVSKLAHDLPQKPINYDYHETTAAA